MTRLHQFATEFVTSVLQGACVRSEDLIAPDFVWHGPSLMGKNGGQFAALREFVQTLHRAFPKLEVAVETPIVEGPDAVVRWTVRGIHTGDALAAPTGRIVQFTGIHILNVVERAGELAVAELWHQWGQMGLLQHLEVIPFIGGPGTELPGPGIERERAPVTAGPGNSNSVTDVNKNMIQRLFDDVINRGNLALTEEYIAAEIKDHNPGPSDLPGRAGIQEVCKLLRKAFPDLHGTVDALIAEGDRVVARWSVRGTNTCDCGGIHATKRAMVGTGIDIVRLATQPDGRRQVVDRWGNSDDTGILIQLGLINAPV